MSFSNKKLQFFAIQFNLSFLRTPHCTKFAMMGLVMKPNASRQHSGSLDNKRQTSTLYIQNQAKLAKPGNKRQTSALYIHEKQLENIQTHTHTARPTSFVSPAGKRGKIRDASHAPPSTMKTTSLRALLYR